MTAAAALDHRCGARRRKPPTWPIPRIPTAASPATRRGDAEDYGKVKVPGEIVALSSQHIAIRRQDPRAGEIVVHFPRAGFLVLPA